MASLSKLGLFQGPQELVKYWLSFIPLMIPVHFGQPTIALVTKSSGCTTLLHVVPALRLQQQAPRIHRSARSWAVSGRAGDRVIGMAGCCIVGAGG